MAIQQIAIDTATGALKTGATARGAYLTAAFYNVADHGVAVDGTTDVTTALNAAIAASPVGSTVIFPPVVYQVSAPIVLYPSRSYVGLGHAPTDTGATIKQKTGTNMTNAAGLTGILVSQAWSANSGFADYGVHIHNLRIDGNRTNNLTSTACGVVLTSARSHVTGCYITDIPKDGVRLTDTTANGSNIVANTCVENRVINAVINSCGGDGIRNVSGNSNSNTDGFIVDTIVQVVDGSAFNLDKSAGWCIKGNHVYAIGVHGMYLKDAFSTHVVDNIVEDFGEQATAAAYYLGISLGQGAIRGSRVSGNFIGCRELSGSVGGYQYLNVTAGYGSTDSQIVVTDNRIHGPASPTNQGIGIVYGTNGGGGVSTIYEDNNYVGNVHLDRYNDGSATVHQGVDTNTAQTLTNKRVTKRVNTVASSATPAINVDTTDQFNITALAAAITSMTTNLTGTPVDGQLLDIRFKDNGTGRAITWGASFTGTLLSTTIANKTHLQRLKYDAAAAKWAGYLADTAGY